MSQSLVYPFLLNMWMMRRIEEDYLTGQVTRRNITGDEKEVIVTSPRITQ